MDKKKLNQEAIANTADLQETLKEMRIMNQGEGEISVEQKVELTEFQKKHPNVRWIKPKYSIPTGGKRNPEMDRTAEKVNEYVVGIFESQDIMGSLDFWLSSLPGDPYRLWNVPVNSPCAVPRHVAKHLSTKLFWKEIKPLPPGQEPTPRHEHEDLYQDLSKFNVKRRGTFHPIDSY